jgi:hypothetical protein
MACAKWFITRGIAAVSLFGAVCFAAPSWTIQSWSAEPPTIRLVAPVIDHDGNF